MFRPLRSEKTEFRERGAVRARAARAKHCCPAQTTFRLAHPRRPVTRPPENCCSQLFIKLRSRSLSELTRQFKPPTKSGHAPPTKESRKSSQSVNPNFVLSWQVFQCWVKLSRTFHILWYPSVNSFKFQSCDHTPPRTQTLLISQYCAYQV